MTEYQRSKVARRRRRTSLIKVILHSRAFQMSLFKDEDQNTSTQDTNSRNNTIQSSINSSQCNSIRQSCCLSREVKRYIRVHSSMQRLNTKQTLVFRKTKREIEREQEKITREI